MTNATLEKPRSVVTTKPWNSIEVLDLILWMSLAAMLICWDKSLFLAGLAIAGAIACWQKPRLIRNPNFWLILASLQAVRNLFVWIRLDDHIAVANYWTIAIALALGSQSILPILRSNARWVIGLVFLFATAWKLSSPEYVSGSFFEYTLLFDNRFLALTTWFGGMSADSLAENYQNMANLRLGLLPDMAFDTVSSSQTHALAWVLTWWTILIEGAVAVAFLAAAVGWVAKFRNWLLIVFAITTYIPIPVTGFCVMLMVLGLSQCETQENRARLGFGITFAAAFLWTPLWHALQM